MTEPSTSPARGAAPPLTESAVVHDPAGASGSDAASQAPWVASPGQPAPPQTATGHYGPGYADPTRHYGDTLPGTPAAERVPQAAADAETPRSTATGSGAGADRPQQDHAGTAGQPDDPRFVPEANRRPDISSEEVGLRPPDHAPSESAPASENAALIFERS